MKDIGDLIKISSGTYGKKDEVIQNKSHHTSVKRKHLMDRYIQDPQDSLLESSSKGSPRKEESVSLGNPTCGIHGMML